MTLTRVLTTFFLTFFLEVALVTVVPVNYCSAFSIITTTKSITTINTKAAHSSYQYQPHYYRRRSSAATTTIAAELTEQVTAEEEEIDNPYERIGIQPDQLGLGISPLEVLKYVGTREQLIQKTMQDIDSFDRKRAEMEVDKFLLDAEMVNFYIQYGKEIERDPDFKVPENPEDQDEGFFSFRTFVIAYLGYVAYGSFPKIFRNWVGDQQAAGTWKGTNIPFIDEWIENTDVVVKNTVVSSSSLSSFSIPTEATTDIVPSSAMIDSTTTMVSSIIPNGITDAIVQSADLVQTISDAFQSMT